MKRISEQRERIEAYRPTVTPAQFYNDRRFRHDREWLILSYLSEILLAAGRPAPVYADKLADGKGPDFQTYSVDRELFERIEVTEVLRPDYARNRFHFEREKARITEWQPPDPHPDSRSSFHDVFQRKLAKRYAADSSLLIYDDVPHPVFPEFLPWHQRILADSWLIRRLTSSKYRSIWVIDPTGKAAVQLSPQREVIAEEVFQ
jgi:hypothetical protein